MHGFQYERERTADAEMCVMYLPTANVCVNKGILAPALALSTEGLAGAAAQHHEHVQPTSWRPRASLHWRNRDPLATRWLIPGGESAR